MSRTDLSYSAKTGDIVLLESAPNSDDIVPVSYTNGVVQVLSEVSPGSSFVVNIPIGTYAGYVKFLIGGVEYPAYYKMANEDVRISGSMLAYISFDLFLVTISGSKVYLTNGYSHDFDVVEAKDQNSSLLALCDQGNNYRYPNSGVGIVNFVNGQSSKNEIASKIIQQFSSDSMTVINASFDESTGRLVIETKEV